MKHVVRALRSDVPCCVPQVLQMRRREVSAMVMVGYALVVKGRVLVRFAV